MGRNVPPAAASDSFRAPPALKPAKVLAPPPFANVCKAGGSMSVFESSHVDFSWRHRIWLRSSPDSGSLDDPPGWQLNPLKNLCALTTLFSGGRGIMALGSR